MTGIAPNGATRQQAGQGRRAPKWDQLRAVEEAREPLGLKGTSISIIRAMMSFMSSDEICERAPQNHIVYASNATIAERSHVSIQTVERHIAKLVELGLVVRVTAANGKRWLRRYSDGSISTVSGLSLLPIKERHNELQNLAARYRSLQSALKAIRDECTLAIAKLSHMNSEAAANLIHRARVLLRRRPKEDVLTSLLQELNDMIGAENGVEKKRVSPNLMGGSTKIEGHKEHSLSQYSKPKKREELKVSQEEMEHSFPKLCKELRFEKSQVDCDRRMDAIASHLGIGHSWYRIKQTHNQAIRFMLLGYILQRAESIRSHEAYLEKIIYKLDAGEITIRSLIATKYKRAGGPEQPSKPKVTEQATNRTQHQFEHSHPV